MHLGDGYQIHLQLQPVSMLPYWSENVIVDVIVSPLPVVEPLMFNPSVKLPLLSIAIASFDEVND